MVVLNGNDPNNNMYACRVLYIGSAPPVDTLKGVEALQEPLRQRFPLNTDDIEGIDANIRVLPTALEVSYIQSNSTLHFPLDRMTICAGVTAVTVTDGTTGEKRRQFVPVNTVNQHDSRNPAIFAAIIRRSQGRQIAECHMFVCNSTRDALHLVNAAATANMALRQQKKRQQRYESSGYENNDVVVVKADVVNVPQNEYFVNGGQYNGRHEEHYIKSDVNTTLESTHYKIQQSNERAQTPETIYVSFDKSNLVTTGENTLEVRSTRQRSVSPRPSPRMETTRFAYRPIATPPPPQPQPVMMARPLPLPPPRPVMIRAPQPQPVFVRPRPQPIMVQAPPPQPIMIRAPPPRPIMVAAPPPPQPMLIRAPPPQPQRMYTRRMVAVPPPPQRYATPAPVYVRSRARSVSPVRGYAESRISRKDGEYQPKWEGERRPASHTGVRMSRRDHYDGPPRDFRQSQFINERAFSRRVHADNGMGQMSPGYQYPNAYDFNNVMMYDRPTTKSNPRYSSSSDSEDDNRDNRMSRISRRSTRR